MKDGAHQIVKRCLAPVGALATMRVRWATQRRVAVATALTAMHMCAALASMERW
jgi:hypothetical protein